MVRSSTDLTRNLAFVGMRKLVPLLWLSDLVLLDVADRLGTLALRGSGSNKMLGRRTIARRTEYGINSSYWKELTMNNYILVREC